MARDGLAVIKQDDWSAGAFFDNRLTPPNGATRVDDGFLDDDGLPYARGGSTAKSNAAAGLGGNALTFLWDGYLAGGQRTVFASSSEVGVLDPDDDATPIDLDHGSGIGAAGPGVEFGGILYVTNGQAQFIYGGSQMPALNYSTGTVTVTNGSATVTGAGTNWTGNIDAGALLKIGSGVGARYHAVKSVDSNTQVTLATPYPGSTAAGSAYAVVTTASFEVAAFSATPVAFASVSGRLVVCEGNRVWFSNIGDPETIADTDYHQLPDGVRIFAARAIRDTLLVFTSHGVWAISNLAYDLTDDDGNVQHRLERVNTDLILWGNGAAIAEWEHRLIVPARDGTIWLIDTVTGPQQIAGGAQEYLAGRIAAGDYAGNAVIEKNHYLVPLVDGQSGLASTTYTLACRLTPTRRGTAFGWTRLALRATALAVRPATQTSSSYVISTGRLSTHALRRQYLFDSATATTDLDTGTAPTFALEVRQANFDVKTLVRKVRVRYVLAYASGVATMAVTWDSEEGNTGTLDTAAEATLGSEPYADGIGTRTRGLTVTLAATNQRTALKVHSVEIFYRPTGKQ